LRQAGNRIAKINIRRTKVGDDQFMVRVLKSLPGRKHLEEVVAAVHQRDTKGDFTRFASIVFKTQCGEGDSHASVCCSVAKSARGAGCKRDKTVSGYDERMVASRERLTELSTVVAWR
jgi:hypothetical protein